jgi:DNA repair exonuclease SbcCD ATPase subunit
MILFRKLIYSNFLSTGDIPTEIDLGNGESTLVVGTNGVGKSTMMDALAFALFGRPHRDINKPQLVNSINGKGCRVEVQFTIGKSDFTVIRGMKPAIFEIWQNKTLLNQESHSRDYQKVLENNILKLNHKSFHQIVVLGSSNFIPFMQLPAYHRREVIEDILGIGIFTKMNVVLKERTAKLKEAIRDTDHQLEILKEKITLQNKHLDRLRVLTADEAKKKNDEIQHLHDCIAQLLESNAVLEVEVADKNAEVQRALGKLKSKRLKLTEFDAQIRANIQKHELELKFFSENDDCPTCRQVIPAAVKVGKKTQYSNTLDELRQGYADLKETIAQCDVDMLSWNATASLITSYNQKINTNASLISSYTTQIAKLQKGSSSTGTSVDITAVEKSLEKLRDNRDTLNNLKQKQTEERTYSEIIGELLKDTGIKTKIIKQYLPVINKLVNHYLQILDFFVSFNLDENFVEQIRSRHRDDFSYCSFSEGEKQRIDLALMFTWRHIAKMKNSVSTNLLILDEIGDSSLDADGVENLLKILNTLDAGTSIYVISHQRDILDGKFQNKIEFEKVSNFSRIKKS